MFSIQKLATGHLKLTADAIARAEILDQMEQGRTSDQILLDGTESYWANGSFTPFEAGDANPFVGITEAPCIAEQLDHEDDGTRGVRGALWWYPAYEHRDPMEVLMRTGSVIFSAA